MWLSNHLGTPKVTLWSNQLQKFIPNGKYVTYPGKLTEGSEHEGEPGEHLPGKATGCHSQAHWFYEVEKDDNELNGPL